MIMMLYVLDILNMNGILDILCLIYIGGLMGGNLDRSLNCKDCVIIILFVNCYWYDLIGGFKEKN